MARVSSATAISSAVQTSMWLRPARRASRTARPAPRSRSSAVARGPIESQVTRPRLVESWIWRRLLSTNGAETPDTIR